MPLKEKPHWLKHLDFLLWDGVCLSLALLLSYRFYRDDWGFVSQYRFRATLGILLCSALIIALCRGSYHNVLPRGSFQELRITLMQSFYVALCAMVWFFLLNPIGEKYYRRILILTVILYTVLTYLVRLLWKRFMQKVAVRRRNSAHMLLVAPEKDIESILKEFAGKLYGKQICGLVVSDRAAAGEMICDLPVVANLETLTGYLVTEWVDEVFLSRFTPESEKITLISALLNMGIPVHEMLADPTEQMEHKRFVEQVGGFTCLSYAINYLTAQQAFAKRALDILGGIVGCLFTGILCLIVGPMIYKADPGPIFFSQIRIGLNGRPFKIYKFRSMYRDAEARKAELMAKNDVSSNLMFKLDDDPRIIKGIGHVIRKYSIDEFPQFLNVLKGDMSLVGTRPPTVQEVALYEEHHKIRLAAKPGITGIWQTSGRSDIKDFEEVVRMDAEYIQTWSFWLDIKLILKTVIQVIRPSGAK